MDATSTAIKTGTSTVGITYDGGVVVGADHRATMGHFIANKSVQKLFRISDNIALTTAGLVGHAQSLSRVLAAELKLYELKRDTPMTVKGAATFTANILSGRPHYVQLLHCWCRPIWVKRLQYRFCWRFYSRCLLRNWLWKPIHVRGVRGPIQDEHEPRTSTSSCG